MSSTCKENKKYDTNFYDKKIIIFNKLYIYFSLLSLFLKYHHISKWNSGKDFNIWRLVV